ncbi:MAG: Gfo/Idh/MocA family oxidoreductase [Deltaproteobacteria bacterium]|nr:Gfo/Idh/MocA family oxidoreductase [Deltaproteobacteria bacterium]
MADERTGLAVVGSGSWGRNHVRSLATMPGVELRWVCEKDEAAAQSVRANHPGVQVTRDLEQVLADDAVKGVVIATHAPSHAPLGKMVLAAGKDALVEKPLALDPADAAELVRLADEGERILMVGHLLLHHPAVEALKTLVDSGELGDILYVVCRRLNLGVVRQNENAWWSLAPHDLSIARYLLGTEPVAVSATGGAFLQTEAGIEDVVFATVRFAGDRLAHVHVSWLDPHKTRMLTVVGSKKMAVFDDTSGDQKLTIYDKGVEPPKSLTYAEGVRVRTGDIRIPAIRMSEPLRREHEAFVRAIETREVPLGDGRSGLAVVRALEAGSRSLAAGGSEMQVRS